MALYILEELDITDGGDNFYEGMVKCKNNFSTIDTEMYGAREGLSSVDARIDLLEVEVTAARGGETDIDERFDNAETNISSLLSDVSTLQTEVTNARDGETNLLTKINALESLPTGYITGLVLSNNSGDANNDIDVSTGCCRSSADAYNCVLSSTMTKRLDASWAAGSGNGGLFSGSKAATTVYNVFLIRNDTTEAIDSGFDTSNTGANKPAGWTVVRWLGYVITDGSSNIRAFVMSQTHIYFPAGFSVATLSIGSGTQSLTGVMPDVSYIVAAMIQGTLTTGAYYNAVSFAAVSGGNQIYYATTASTTDYGHTSIWIPLPTKNIYWVVAGTGGSCNMYFYGVEFNR